MGALAETLEPYLIRFSDVAAQQAGAVPDAVRQSIARRLVQLAELAAFAARYSVSMSRVEKLVAHARGVWITYEISDTERMLTVTGISLDEKPSLP